MGTDVDFTIACAHTKKKEKKFFFFWAAACHTSMCEKTLAIFLNEQSNYMANALCTWAGRYQENGR